MYCDGCRRQAWLISSRSFGWYRPPLSRAILQLKYRPNRELADLLAGWLADELAASGWRVSLLASVPLDAVRLRQRGFNQVDLLVEGLGRRTGIPVRTGALARVRVTRSQVGLDHASRQQNVAGAFRAVPGLVVGQRVLVVDDLRTTGATLRACAVSLHEAGAEAVYGLTLGLAGGR